MKSSTKVIITAALIITATLQVVSQKRNEAKQEPVIYIPATVSQCQILLDALSGMPLNEHPGLKVRDIEALKTQIIEAANMQITAFNTKDSIDKAKADSVKNIKPNKKP